MKLTNFFNPESLLVIGASANPEKLGAQVLQNILASGYLGQVLPINPKGGRIGSLAVYPSISEAARKIKEVAKSLAVVAIPAFIVPLEIENLAKAGIKNIVIISAGFKEAGYEGKVLEDKIVALANKYKLNILGPNCLGFINHFSRLNASFSKSYGLSGSGVAVLSQSGAIGSAVLDWSQSSGSSLPLFISLGNKAVLNENDFLNYFIQEKKSLVSALVLYLEEFSDGEELVRLVSVLSKTKPVAILKSGKSAAGALAAQSHTGSMAGSWAVAEASLKRAGAIILEDLSDLFSFLELCRRPFSFSTLDLAIVSNAGGPAVLATDACARLSLKLKPLNKSLAKALPRLHIANPLDLIGDAKALDYKLALSNILADKNFNTVLVILTPQTSSEIEATAKEIIILAKKYPKKNIVTSFVGGKSLMPALESLRLAGVPNFSSPETALRVLSLVDLAAKNYLSFGPVKKASITKTKSLGNLDYLSALNFLKANGIKTVKTVSVNNISSLKKPLVLKASGPDFIHKSDKQAIYLNLDSQVKIDQALSKLKKIGGDRNGNIIVAQEMLAPATEMILGFKRDASFGPILMLGMGGIYTEVLKDFALGFGDLKEKQITAMLKSLKLYPLLSGARGQESLDTKVIVKTLMILQKIAWNYPEILEMEINPLMVYKRGVVAADVRIIR